MVLSFWTPSLYLLSARLTREHHHSWFMQSWGSSPGLQACKVIILLIYSPYKYRFWCWKYMLRVESGRQIEFPFSHNTLLSILFFVPLYVWAFCHLEPNSWWHSSYEPESPIDDGIGLVPHGKVQLLFTMWPSPLVYFGSSESLPKRTVAQRGAILFLPTA